MEATRKGWSERKDVIGHVLKFGVSVQRVRIPSGQSVDPQAGNKPCDGVGNCRASCQLGQNAWARKGDFHCSGGLCKSLLIDHSAMCSGCSDSPCTSFSNLLWESTMPGCRRHVTQCRV